MNEGMTIDIFAVFFHIKEHLHSRFLSKMDDSRIMLKPGEQADKQILQMQVCKRMMHKLTTTVKCLWISHQITVAHLYINHVTHARN